MLQENKESRFKRVVVAARYGILIPGTFGVLGFFTMLFLESLWVAKSFPAKASIVAKSKVSNPDSSENKDVYEYRLRLNDSTESKPAQSYFVTHGDNLNITETLSVRCSVQGECKSNTIFDLWGFSLTLFSILLILSVMYGALVKLMKLRGWETGE